MAAPVYVQESSEGSVTSGTSGNVSLTGVGAGSLLVIVIMSSTGTRTLTPSDNVGSTWSTRHSVSDVSQSQYSQIDYAICTAGGSVTITLTANASATYRFKVLEFSGPHATPTDQTSSLVETSNTTGQHTSSASASVIDTAADVLVVVAGTLNSASGVTGIAPGSGYTQVTSANAITLWQYKTSAGALTDEQGAWSNTGTARLGRSCIASFIGASGGVTGNPWYYYGQQ